MNPENPYEAPQTPQFDTSSEKFAAEPMTLTSILFSFEGRIPRRVYWGASLGTSFVAYAIVFLLVILFEEDSPAVNVGIFVLYIPLIWTSLAIQTKRWHDLDKPGWWICINFIPCIGPLWALIENGFLRGTIGSNQYGLDPT